MSFQSFNRLFCIVRFSSVIRSFAAAKVVFRWKLLSVDVRMDTRFVRNFSNDENQKFLTFFPPPDYSRDKHFSTKDLWPSATPNKFSVLSSTMTDLYTPKISTSNRFFVKEVRKYRKSYGSTAVSKSDNWKSLNRFEATKDNDSLVLFTGGPVLSMAWVPVPDDHLSQLLAVCCRNDADEDILLCDTKPVKCLIQIWNFNKLKNGQMRHAPVPHLLYGIAYDHGPVIQMEFCPSGGFTEDRLGLLAVSSFDGHVDVLALPKNVTSDNSKIENLVFRIEPSLTLCCELDQPLGVLLTKLVWSQVNLY